MFCSGDFTSPDLAFGEERMAGALSQPNNGRTNTGVSNGDTGRYPTLKETVAVSPSGFFPPPLLADARVARTQSIIRRQMHLRITLPALAAETGLSVSRLSHLFKGQTGHAPARYLKQFRMDRARELLETSFLSVKEICAQVGVGDVSHFVRDFEKIYGLSPSRYRLKAGIRD